MKQIVDHVGIVLSCICLVHCLLLPIMIVLLQVDFHMEGFHEGMLVLTMLVSGHALWHGYKKHCKHIVLAFGIIGVTCMAVALLVHSIEVILTTIGASLILSAHVLNMRGLNCCINSKTKIGVCHETHN